MKLKRANPSNKPSPSATPSSAETSAGQAAEAAQPTTESGAGEWIPLSFLETTGVYLCPAADAKDVMISRLFAEAGPLDNQGWQMRLTAMGVFVHRKGAPMQWVALQKCVRAIAGSE